VVEVDGVLVHFLRWLCCVFLCCRFDEVHFGGYAMHYLKRRFFFDVHPPLGKLLFAMVLSWSGYDGNFSFEKIGLYFEQDVPYTAMR